MADLPRLRRLLLGLIGPVYDLEALELLEAEDWQRLAGIAEEHRLEPLLHARLLGEPVLDTTVPAEMKSRWARAHRAAGLAALAQRADLFATVKLLEDAGVASVALKGAFLAWHAYPAAALRPLRDLDLLVPAHRAIEAWKLLHERGYQAPDGEPDPLEPATVKDLPLLLAPQGTPVELHRRCWEVRDAAFKRMPEGQDARILAEAAPAAPDDPVPYPAPADKASATSIRDALALKPVSVAREYAPL